MRSGWFSGESKYPWASKPHPGESSCRHTLLHPRNFVKYQQLIHKQPTYLLASLSLLGLDVNKSCERRGPQIQVPHHHLPSPFPLPSESRAFCEIFHTPKWCKVKKLLPLIIWKIFRVFPDPKFNVHTMSLFHSP